MNPFDILGLIRGFAILGVFTLGGLLGFTALLWGEVSQLRSFQRRFGTDWKAEYEQVIGPVATAHTRIALSVLGLIAIVALSYWFYRILRHQPAKASPRKKHHSRRSSSPIERTVRYRRNALVGNYFGLAGIVAGLLLVVVDWGMFRDHDDEASLGLFVFLAGYCGLISGCWWWLKAKSWNETVVLIGLLPVVILFIPYVRLMFVAIPELLPVMMVMMPLILFVVVLVLPDHSGPPRRRSSWEHDDRKNR